MDADRYIADFRARVERLKKIQQAEPRPNTPNIPPTAEELAARPARSRRPVDVPEISGPHFIVGPDSPFYKK